MAGNLAGQGKNFGSAYGQPIETNPMPRPPYPQPTWNLGPNIETNPMPRPQYGQTAPSNPLWSPAFNGGAAPPGVSASYPQLFGGPYNQMTQMLAGPSYSMAGVPRPALTAPRAPLNAPGAPAPIGGANSAWTSPLFSGIRPFGMNG